MTEFVRTCLIAFSAGLGLSLIVKSFIDDHQDYFIMGVLALLISLSASV